MARATMPTLSASWGSMSRMTGVSPSPAKAAPCRCARRMPWRSSRRTRRAQYQYFSPDQVLASASEAVDVKRALARAGETDGPVADDDLVMAGNELIEARHPLDLGAAPAAGAARGVRDAALLGAVGEDGLERRAVEPRDGHPGEALIDRQLVARIDDLGNGDLASA